MSNKTSKTTRRTFLKGLAYTSALSLGGLSSLAFAKSTTHVSNSVLSTCDIHLLPTQNSDAETLSLFNHSDVNVTIESIDRLNLDNENKFLAIKVNKLDKQYGKNSVTLEPGETMEYEVSDKSSDYQKYSSENGSLDIPNVLAGQSNVNSIHLAFGNIPITIYDSLAA